MSLQRFQGSFRSGAIGSLTFNLAGQLNTVDPCVTPATDPSWTQGATLIDALTLIPPANQQWTLQQLSISAGLTISTGVFLPGMYGKFGKILAGLATLLTPTISQGVNHSPCQPGVQLPADQTAIGTLWDPDSDMLPPAYSTNVAITHHALLPVALTITPPTPLPIDAGEAIGVGIWMLPSLLGDGEGTLSVELAVLNAAWAVIYDDGVTPPNYG